MTKNTTSRSTEIAAITKTLTLEIKPLEPYLPETYDPKTAAQHKHTFDKATIARIGTYEWLDPARRETALTALRGAIAAAGANQTDALVFALTALADIWSKDRAYKASALIKARPPTLGQNLPKGPPGAYNPTRNYSYITNSWEGSHEQVFQPISWQSGMPE
jgi:hypothetical protein